ncbi:DUF3221 domain-containing protein [Paraclostridium sordellii]|uniref:DUF3221 domain-containing protein n=1 Tax=Paraclostridium sordellii TaxID=1505 RepID=UPI0005E03EBB|nr:DUF3221 domain-containing protein [Paeniclostridium sordellii]CEQ16539.1 Uncharacterised protein [[Clostridium] sordellii] [Paeniclostridium sordellii]
MKKKIIELLTVGLISVSGVLIFANNKSSIAKNDLDSNKENVDLSEVKDIAIRGLIKDISVDKDTIISKGDSSSNLKISDLKIGQRIEVVFQGPEGRSYPVTANAHSINIINE